MAADSLSIRLKAPVLFHGLLTGWCPRSDDRNAVYAYIKYTNASNPVDFGVFAKVENAENGNIEDWNKIVSGYTATMPISTIYHNGFNFPNPIQIVDSGKYYGILVNK